MAACKYQGVELHLLCLSVCVCMHASMTLNFSDVETIPVKENATLSSE